jgi:hypothetical protein
VSRFLLSEKSVPPPKPLFSPERTDNGRF